MSLVANRPEDQVSSTSEEWTFVALLHNLSVSEPTGNDYISIAPKDDSRATHLRERSPAFCKLVDSFTSQLGKPVKPSLLLVRKDVSLDLESIIAFRNALAISSIVRAWEHSLRGKQLEHLKFSDYFDLYPYSLLDGNHLATNTPAEFGAAQCKNFHGQCSPELFAYPNVGQFYDEELFAEILQRWVYHYIERKGAEWSMMALFRSLEMAYRASSLPFRNNATTHDYGTNLALILLCGSARLRFWRIQRIAT